LTLERDVDDAGEGAFGPTLRAGGDDVPIIDSFASGRRHMTIDRVEDPPCN
jgi:hypothetical protein